MITTVCRFLASFFRPQTTNISKWGLVRLGQYISCLKQITNGSSLMHKSQLILKLWGGVLHRNINWIVDQNDIATLSISHSPQAVALLEALVSFSLVVGLAPMHYSNCYTVKFLINPLDSLISGIKVGEIMQNWAKLFDGLFLWTSAS